MLVLASTANAQEPERKPLDLSLHFWDSPETSGSSLDLPPPLDPSKERGLGFARLYFITTEQEMPDQELDFNGQRQAQAVIDFADEMFLLVAGTELPTMLQSNTFELMDTELPPVLVFGTNREKLIQLTVPLN